jgi:hypothetical protein
VSNGIAGLEAIVALGLFMVLNSVTGVRLLWLASRTRELPELYLGIGHLLGGALGWALVLMSYIIGSPTTSSPALALMLGGLFCLNVAHVALSLFAWRVFAPGSRWQAIPFAIVSLTLVADFIHNGLMLRVFAPPPSELWFWPGCLARSAAWVWLTTVTFAYHRKLRRRLPLGLTDPVTVNRMFLMFLAGAFIVVLALVVNTASVLGVWTRHPLLMVSLSSILGAPSAFCSWLAFVPPRRYTDWIARRSPAPAE